MGKNNFLKTTINEQYRASSFNPCWTYTHQIETFPQVSG